MDDISKIVSDKKVIAYCQQKFAKRDEYMKKIPQLQKNENLFAQFAKKSS
jgi:hypothetical protein